MLPRIEFESFISSFSRSQYFSSLLVAGTWNTGLWRELETWWRQDGDVEAQGLESNQMVKRWLSNMPYLSNFAPITDL